MKFIISSVLISVLLFYSQNKMKYETPLNRSSLENIDNEIVEPVSGSNIEFKKELVFGTNNDVVIGEVTTVAIDRKGYVYIADGTQTRIHVFSEKGKYIKSLGRQGAGPGDFSGLTFNTSMTILSKNLFITDTKFYFPHRANVFSIDDLKFSYTIKLIPENLKDYKILKGYLPKQIVQENKGTLLVSFEQPPSLYKEGESFIYYALINSDNNIVSKPILKLKNRKNITYLVEGEHPYLAMHSFPFFEKSLFAISTEGIIYRAQSDEFKIHIYDSKGNYKSSFSHPFVNKVFRKNKTIENYKKTGYKSELGDGVAIKMLENAKNLPKTWPALDNMFIDDENRIWVSTIVDNDEIYEWWILENSGQLINTFEWSRDKPIQTVRNNKLYTIEENPKTFEKEVIQYQILMNE